MGWYGGECSVTSGSWLNYNLTTKTSAAGRGVDNGGRSCGLYEAHGRKAKVAFISITAAPEATPPSHASLDDNQPARGGEHTQQEGKGREERRGIHSQVWPLPLATVGEEATVVAAPTTTVVGAAAALDYAVNASPQLA